MKPSEWEVIILKPTPVFQAFIAAQCPDIDAPDLKTLQTDCTAYAIPKQANDEETLNTIESHYNYNILLVPNTYYPAYKKCERLRQLYATLCTKIIDGFIDSSVFFINSSSAIYLFFH